MTKAFRSWALVGVATAVLAAVTPAHAQEQAQEADDSRFGGEIIVTATKRAENVQDVSAAVTALGEASLDMAGIVDPTRLGLVVPGLRSGYSGTEARFAIRGARTNNVGPQAQQVVGIFNDGAYVATVGQVMAAYLDVNRIEVLRGPQGTLYGRNTFAGAINIISNDPKFDEISGNAQILYGDYSRIRGEAVLNLPVSETFSVRIAAMGEQHDGYIKNTVLDGPRDDLRNENVRVGRITAKWKPSDSFDATLRYTKYHRDINVDALYGYTIIGCYQNPGSATTASGLSATAVFRPGHCFRPGPDSAASTDAAGVSRTVDKIYTVGRDGPSRALAKGDDLNLQMNYDFGPVTLSFIGAYNKYKSVQYYDPDYSDGYHYGMYGQSSLTNFFAGYDNDQKSHSAELRLASNGDTKFKWLLGAYMFKQSSENDFGYLDNGRFTRYNTSLNDSFKSKSKAVFANASYEVVEGVRILGGLRYNDDSQTLISGANGGGGNKTLWRAGLEFDAGPDAMLYATASTGYRVGGVNGSGVVSQGAPPVFGAENVTAYEAGFKSQFMDRTLTLNGSFFYNRFRNMHAQSFVSACIDPNNPASCIASEFTSNGGKIDSKGAELEFNWLPGDNFFLNGSIAYLDAKFGNYLVSRLDGLGNFQGRQDVTVARALAPTLQLKGWRPALSPKFTMAMQTGYVVDINDDNSITPMAQLSYSSKYWSFDYNLPGSEQKSFAKLDLRLTWRNKDKGLTVEGFIENVTNKAVLVRSVVFRPDEPNLPSAAIQSNYGDPRTWGIRVGLDF